MCNVHYDALQNAEASVKKYSSVCFFPKCDRTAELRPVRIPPAPGGSAGTAGNVSDGNDFFEWEDRLLALHAGKFLLSDLEDRHLCSACLWLLSSGSAGRRTQSSNSLPSPAMSAAVTFARAKLLRNSPISGTAPENVSLQPISTLTLSGIFAEYARSCSTLNMTQRDRRTLKSVVAPVLATSGINLTRGVRGEIVFYNGDSLARRALATDADAVRDTRNNISLTAADEHKFIVQAGLRFKEMNVLTADWSMRSQVEQIPTAWWSFTMFSLSSERKRRRWAASAMKLNVDNLEMWPVCNKSVPTDWAESLLPGTHRLVVRALFMFEHKVFSCPSVAQPGPLLLSLILTNSKRLPATDLTIHNFFRTVSVPTSYGFH